ncbi:MAG: rubrerythrin family protein [Patescibacteria group bacterium]|nr:rubrerythrin family protein [Patescibacteria group bacterium]
MRFMEQAYLSRARNELTEQIIYHALALREKNPENRAALERLSAQEGEHAKFWQELLPGVEIRPHRFTIKWIPFLRAVFGVTFTIKLLETHEKDAVKTYRAMLPGMPASHRAGLEKIIQDEESHEKALIGQLKEKRIAYIGFIALGLADAIVEITGVHAGFLGVTGSTLIAGISGVIVGFAAAISMGSAAYLQAKQDTEKSPVVSAFATGISYLCSVVLLATPYFLISAMLVAFVVSTSIGVGLLAAFTFYGAIVFDRKFLGEFTESVSLMLGTALATFLLGALVGKVFHVGGKNF